MNSKKQFFVIYKDNIDKESNGNNLVKKHNNIESTAICESTYSSFLKCVADYENQNINDKILIDVNKDPKLGTITFQKLQVEPQKIIDYVTFSINYEINSGYLNQNDKLEIIIVLSRAIENI